MAKTPEFDLRNNPLKNHIINGNFDFWQRGTSLSSGTGNRYCADRWAGNSTGSTYTPSRQSFTEGQTEVPNNPRYFHRMVVSSSAGAGNFALLGYKVESARTLAGRKATFTFWAKADSTKNISLELVQEFGAGGSPSATLTGLEVNKIAITATWAKYSITVTVPSVAGKTFGTTHDGSLALLIWLDAGSTFNSRTNTLGQQSGTFDFAQIQLNDGPVAAPFQIAGESLGNELVLCQRFYEKSHSQDTPPSTSGLGTSGSAVGFRVLVANHYGHISFAAVKRAVPSITYYNPNSGATGTWRDFSAGADRTLGGDGLTTGGFMYQVSGGVANNQMGGNWTADAEL